MNNADTSANRKHSIYFATFVGSSKFRKDPILYFIFKNKKPEFKLTKISQQMQAGKIEKKKIKGNIKMRKKGALARSWR